MRNLPDAEYLDAAPSLPAGSPDPGGGLRKQGGEPCKGYPFVRQQPAGALERREETGELLERTRLLFEEIGIALLRHYRNPPSFEERPIGGGMFGDRLCPLKNREICKESSGGVPCRLNRGRLRCKSGFYGFRSIRPFSLFFNGTGEYGEPFVPRGRTGCYPGLAGEEIEFVPEGDRQVRRGRKSDNVLSPVITGGNRDDIEQSPNEW